MNEKCLKKHVQGGEMAKSLLEKSRSINISSKAIFAALVTVVLASQAACWSANLYYGVDKIIASNVFVTISTTAFVAVLFVPWINLKEQVHLSRSELKEMMITYWLGLCAVAHISWELPWVLFHHYIMGKPGEGQVWSYLWWSYADGGDTRYFAPDGNLLALESAAAVMGLIEAYLVYLRIKTGRYSDMHLVAVIAAMACEFYPTVLYILSEFYEGMPHVHGVANFIVKFGYGNILWLIVPWIVFIWASRMLIARRAAIIA